MRYRATNPKYSAQGKHWEKQSPEGAEVETTELIAAIVRHQKPLWALETGTAHGQTAEAIGKALKANGRGELWSCDIDRERVHNARARVEGLPVQIFEQTGESLIRSVAEGEPDRHWDFCFIDSWWQPVRVEEVELVIPHIAPGGYLCGHDVCQNYALVYEAAAKTGWPGMVFHAPYGLFVFQKPSEHDCIGAGVPVELEEIL